MYTIGKKKNKKRTRREKGNAIVQLEANSVDYHYTSKSTMIQTFSAVSAKRTLIFIK